MLANALRTLVRPHSVLFARCVTRSSFAVWPFVGQSITGRYSQPSETTIQRPQRATLGAEMGVHHGKRCLGASQRVGWKGFFPDWAGNLYAVNAAPGALVWTHSMVPRTPGFTNDLRG